jgi:tetratricopeptide (TPR) repeat protein
LLFKKKGLALRNLNRIPEAVKCFEKAIEINRKDYESVDGFYNRNETPPGF